MNMSELATKFLNASKRVDAETEKKMDAFAQVGVGFVKTAIQGYHAVDTGTMLNSTQAEKVAPKTYLIGPTVDYAVYVALGTSRMAARPFHIRAAKSLQGAINQGNILGDLGL